MQNKLKIAFLSIHSSPLGALGAKDTGGMSAYLRGMTEALGAAGHLVDIYTRTVAGTNSKVTVISANVRLIAVNDGLGRLNKYELAPHTNTISETIETFRQQHNHHYDLVFSHYWISGLVGQQLQAKWRLPHLLMFHTLGRAKNELCPGESEPLERLAAEEELACKADLVIAAAQSERKRSLNYYGLEPNRIQVIPVGIDRKLFRPLSRSMAKQKAGLGTAEKIILAVGRLEPIKGFDLLLAAAARIDPTVDFKVVLVGGDDQGRDLAGDLKKTAGRLNLSDRVVFAGRAAYEFLPYYYNAAEVTVIPSYYESFGLVALESLACNTPVIAGPVGVIPELAEIPGSDSHLHLVAGRSPALWADRISRVVTSPKLNPETGVGRLLIPYSWPVAADRFAETCRSVLSNKL